MGAVEDSGIQLAPRHVYRMTHEQSTKSTTDQRLEFIEASKQRDFKPIGERWYADNTREPIRDETLREGLVRIGAVVELEGVPTTSGRGRYSLKKDFAELFDPNLNGDNLSRKIDEWQKNNLSKAALTRLSLAAIAASGESDVLVTFPNKETRRLTAGPSSQISKHVIEVFAPKYLRKPGVLWLSTSGNKVVARDNELANSIGLKIDVSKDLPDIILVDFGLEELRLVFVEVVATDGAISERRKQAIYSLVDAAGFDRRNVIFLTAYSDRTSQGFSKTFKDLAWDSYVWFMSEPDNIICLIESAQPI